jgi:hypothetical protein
MKCDLQRMAMLFANRCKMAALNVHLHEIFLFWFFALIKHTYISQIIRLLSVFDFVLEFADLF